MDETAINNKVNNFRGQSDHSLDGKGRLNIPARFRDVLGGYQDDSLMVVPWKDCLKAYPTAEWEKLEATLRNKAREQPAQLKTIKYMIGAVTLCSLDKQNRILLSPKLRAGGFITKEVVLSGVLEYFEIWDKTTWEQNHKPSADEFDNFDKAILEWGLL